MNLQSCVAEQDANLECHRDRLFKNDCCMRAQVLALPEYYCLVMTLREPLCRNCGKFATSCVHFLEDFDSKSEKSTESTSKRLGSELEKLFQLFKSGALTSEEYDKAKKTLIGN